MVPYSGDYHSMEDGTMMTGASHGAGTDQIIYSTLEESNAGDPLVAQIQPGGGGQGGGGDTAGDLIGGGGQGGGGDTMTPSRRSIQHLPIHTQRSSFNTWGHIRRSSFNTYRYIHRRSSFNTWGHIYRDLIHHQGHKL